MFALDITTLKNVFESKDWFRNFKFDSTVKCLLLRSFIGFRLLEKKRYILLKYEYFNFRK